MCRNFDRSIDRLPPISELAGVQARLRNLGFHAGRISGELDDDTRDAIEQFQRKRSLPITREPDDATVAKLRAEYEAT